MICYLWKILGIDGTSRTVNKYNRVKLIHIWQWWVSDKRHELPTLGEHRDSHHVFGEVCVVHLSVICIVFCFCFFVCLFVWCGFFLVEGGLVALLCFSSSCVLCVWCCHCLWIVHFFYCPSVFSNVYLLLILSLNYNKSYSFIWYILINTVTDTDLLIPWLIHRLINTMTDT
jgi:hypothetical protein